MGCQEHVHKLGYRTNQNIQKNYLNLEPLTGHPKQLINSMNGVRIIPSDKTVEEKSVDVSKVNKYRISQLIKSMETGIQVSEDISDDYKKEIGEIRTKRSL